jgi:hypothetical protein
VENMVQPDGQGTGGNIVRYTCWISKAINTHTEYIIFTAFPLQQYLRERASVLRYWYVACLVRKHDHVTFRTAQWGGSPVKSAVVGEEHCCLRVQADHKI